MIQKLRRLHRSLATQAISNRFAPVSVLSSSKMIPLIPYWRLSVDSPLTPQQILSALATTPKFVWLNRRNRLPAENTSTPTEFQLERLKWIWADKNPFLPRIYGRIYLTDTGSRIQLVMTLFPIVWIVIIGLALVLSPIIWTGLKALIAEDQYGELASTIVPGYLYVMGSFDIEALAAHQLLKELFQVD